MDPKAALQRVQEAIDGVYLSPEVDSMSESVMDKITDAQDALADLSEWVSKGGFLPTSEVA